MSPIHFLHIQDTRGNLFVLGDLHTGDKILVEQFLELFIRESLSGSEGLPQAKDHDGKQCRQHDIKADPSGVLI